MKENHSHPGPDQEDHKALERLVSSEKGIINAIFFEGALIIGFDPAIFTMQSCNAPVLPHYVLALQRKFRIILAPTPTKIPLTLRDAEVILEKQRKADREAEQFLQGLDKFQDKSLKKKVDDSDDPPNGEERD